MKITTIVRNNRIYARIGDKRIVVTPHQTEVFETSASKIEAVQRKLRNAVADHFERNKKDVLAQFRRGASNLSLSKDDEFEKQFRSLLFEIVTIGGNRGLSKIKARDAWPIFEDRGSPFVGILPKEKSTKQASEVPFSDVEGDIGAWKKWVKAIPGDQFGGTSEFRQATMSYQLAEGIGIDMQTAAQVGKPVGSVLKITSDRGLESVARISRVGDDLVVNTISTAPWNIKGLPQANRVGGYGTKMIDDIAGRALADPTIKNLKLNPIRDAEGFYEKLGFKQVSSGGTRHKYVGMNRAELETFRKQYTGTAPFKLFDSADPNVMAWMNNNSAAMITKIDDISMLNARAVISRGVSENLTNREISKRLEEKFSSWGARYPGKQSRAEMIARTETARGVNVGTLHGYHQSDVVKKVKVIDNEVAHSCQACRDANGQIWEINSIIDTSLKPKAGIDDISDLLSTEHRRGLMGEAETYLGELEKMPAYKDNIKSVHVFGSFATDKVKPGDIDLFVRMKEPRAKALWDLEVASKRTSDALGRRTAVHATGVNPFDPGRDDKLFSVFQRQMKEDHGESAFPRRIR